MARIAYFRVSTSDQSIESQRHALGGHFDLEFSDEGVSGAVLAAQRPGFAALLQAVDVLIKGRKKDISIHVYAVDRLGRDALDVQATVRALLARGVSVDVHGLGVIAKGVGELILAVLAQVADMERNRIKERTEAGRATAREHLTKHGKTHRGKTSMGRPVGTVGKGDERHSVEPASVVAWRSKHGESIAATAGHFGLSVSTVKRYCAAA